MQQYAIKARYPGTILFFRMGDFYEMFEDDARLAARPRPHPDVAEQWCARSATRGCPVKAAAEYLRRLIAKGHRVAICEQTEDPSSPRVWYGAKWWRR